MTLATGRFQTSYLLAGSVIGGAIYPMFRGWRAILLGASTFGGAV